LQKREIKMKLALTIVPFILCVTEAAWADTVDVPPACVPEWERIVSDYNGREASENRRADLPRLTASPELNDLVHEYWKIKDDVAGSSQVASLYGGFYGSTDFSPGLRVLAGPLLAVRVSPFSSSAHAALVRAVRGEERIVKYGLPDALHAIEDRTRELRDAVDRAAEQLRNSQQEDSSPLDEPSKSATSADSSTDSGEASVAQRARAQYKRDTRLYAKQQLRDRCRDWLNLQDSAQMARDWQYMLTVEVQSQNQTLNAWWRVLVPTSLQLGIGYGFRIGYRPQSDPDTLTTGHIGVMAPFGQGVIGAGLVLGQNNYRALYISIGTDLGLHK
jgi:hypothetical protein